MTSRASGIHWQTPGCPRSGNRVISVPTSVLGALRHIEYSVPPSHSQCTGFASFLIGEGIDVYLVRYHECGIEAKSEVTDDLDPRLSCLCICSGNLLRRKKRSGVMYSSTSSAVIPRPLSMNFRCFFFRIDNDLNFRFVIIRVVRIRPSSPASSSFVIASQPLEISSRTEDIVVGIQPFFDNRENIFTVDGKTSCSFTHIVTTPFYMFQFFIQVKPACRKALYLPCAFRYFLIVY